VEASGDGSNAIPARPAFGARLMARGRAALE